MALSAVSFSLSPTVIFLDCSTGMDNLSPVCGTFQNLDSQTALACFLSDTVAKVVLQKVNKISKDRWLGFHVEM